MTENVVQWVLLRRPDYLAKMLDVNLHRKVAEYQTTDFGIIDFAFNTAGGEIAVVELETSITTTAKLEFCHEQSTRYKQLATLVSEPLRVFVLFDSTGTNRAFTERLKRGCLENGLELRSYSILDVQRLYQSCMEELERTSGIYLGRPVAMNVTHLRILNRLLAPFQKGNLDLPLAVTSLIQAFSKSESGTAFRVRRILAEHFDLLCPAESEKDKQLRLTDLGREFCRNMTLSQLNSGHEFNLGVSLG